MVTAGVCFGGKEKLHFVAEMAKVSTKYYVENLLPHLIDDRKKLLPDPFIFQQDEALGAHTAKLAQEWIAELTLIYKER